MELFHKTLQTHLFRLYHFILFSLLFYLLPSHLAYGLGLIATLRVVIEVGVEDDLEKLVKINKLNWMVS